MKLKVTTFMREGTCDEFDYQTVLEVYKSEMRDLFGYEVQCDVLFGIAAGYMLDVEVISDGVIVAMASTRKDQDGNYVTWFGVRGTQDDTLRWNTTKVRHKEVAHRDSIREFLARALHRAVLYELAGE